MKNTARILLCAAVLAGSLLAQNATCRITKYGTSCGPMLSASVQPNAQFNVVTFRVQRALATSPGALVFGLRQLSLRLPGTRCLVLVDPAFTIAFNSDANGRAVRTLSIPRSLNGTGFVQAVSFTPAAIRTSNGLRITCAQR